MSAVTVIDDPQQIDFDLAYRWLAGTYWGGLTSRETFDRAVANCFCVAAFLNDTQLGFARAVTDYATFAWVSDVVVAPEARGKGVGRAMVQHMLDHPRLQGLRRWNLNTRDAQGVYAPLGFSVAADNGSYMERLDATYAASVTPGMSMLRPDLAIIAATVRDGARVLDIGCGDGALMAALRDKGCDARGIEIDGSDVTAALARGLSVMQGDADTDLADYPDASFDYAILSQTLQTTRRPDLVIDQLLRIGARAFVSFPNFAQWRIRLALMFGGTMPVTKQLPDRWYDTPNIHHVTIDDFRAFIAARGVRIEGQWFLRGDRQIGEASANLFAEHAVFLLSRHAPA